MTLDGADREAERPPASLRVLRFVAGLLLFLVAPVWLGAAYYVNVALRILGCGGGVGMGSGPAR